MTNRGATYPSPLKSMVLHAAGSLLAFAATLSVGAGLIHLLGDERAASPTLRVALFVPEETTGASGPDRGLMGPGPISGSNALQGDLALDRSPAEGVSLTASGAMSQPPSAEALGSLGVSDEGRQMRGIRINGQEVLPGQSLSAVRSQHSDYSEGGAAGQLAHSGTPFEKYARPFENPDDHPTVSIIVGGLGINWTRSMSAIEELPPEVTLSFAPSAPNLSAWIRRARAAGHEVLIELPMEPYDHGRARPHPQILRTDAAASQNVRNLGILLAKGTGYAGVVNFQGDKFATQPDAIAPILEHLSANGLAFFGDGHLAGSGLRTAGQVEGLIFGQAATAIDARPEAAEIETQLLLLEAEALEHGASMGSAMPFPITIDLLKDWFERLDQQGILIAPATHFARRNGTSGQIEVAELSPQG